MTKKESKEKREIIEESKENLKAKSDDSGEEKNGDDDSQKNGPRKKGDCCSQTSACKQRNLRDEYTWDWLYSSFY